MADDRRFEALMELAKYCLYVKPSRVIGCPDRADALNLIDDLTSFSAKVDAVVEAMGEYADSVIGIGKKDLRLFNRQLTDAIEGNATFVIEEACKANLEGMATEAQEFRRGYAA